jgi:hypothetical protein
MVNPQTLFMWDATFVLALNLLKMTDAKVAKIKYQTSPVEMKVAPSARNAQTVFFEVG